MPTPLWKLFVCAALAAPTPESYRARLREIAGFDVPPDSAYDEAVRLRTALYEPLRATGAAVFGGTPTVQEVLRRMRTDPSLVITDPDSVVAAYRRTLDVARQRIRPLFLDAPDAPLLVQAIPAAQAASAAPAGYNPASAGHLATFYVNAHQPGGIARMNIALGVAHEAYPGHHLERLYRNASPSAAAPGAAGEMAFTEGWGIYAEQLGDEAGLYDDPVSRLGYLVHLFDVYMALQVDIGMHARGWAWQAAVDTMEVVAARPHAQATSYANRHAATPGQLASYAIGYRAIGAAREAAMRALGDRFDRREFHEMILREGGASLPTMRERVQAWIRERAGG